MSRILFGKLNPEDAGIAQVTLTQANVTSLVSAVLGLAGMVAVLFIVLGGISYATSAGDPGKISKAKDTILYAIIGLVVTIISFVAVQFILGGMK